MSDANQRQSARLDLATEVTAKLLIGAEKNAQQCVVTIRDFSRGGASLYTNFKAPAAAPLKLLIEGITPSWIDGVVAWCTAVLNDPQAPTGATFRMGIAFRPADRAGQASLAAAFEKISALADAADAADDDDGT